MQDRKNSTSSWHASPTLNSRSINSSNTTLTLPGINYLKLQTVTSPPPSLDTFEHPKESKLLIDSLMKTIHRLQASQSSSNDTIAHLESENYRLRREIESLTGTCSESDHTTPRRHSLPDPQPSQIPPPIFSHPSSAPTEPSSLSSRHSPLNLTSSLPLPSTYTCGQRPDTYQNACNTYPGYLPQNHSSTLPPPSQLYHRHVVQQRTPPEPSQRTTQIGGSPKYYGEHY